MNTNSISPEVLEELRGKLKAARDMVSALCHGDRQWTMSVPAQPNTDPDLVISDGLRAGSTLLSTLSSLKEENERLKEALKPSGETKAAYIGEFSLTFPRDYIDEDGEWREEQRKINVPWTTIKEIMKAISVRAALQQHGGFADE